jgi:hypothetical protein
VFSFSLVPVTTLRSSNLTESLTFPD